jgi:hypothetical protein
MIGDTPNTKTSSEKIGGTSFTENRSLTIALGVTMPAQAPTAASAPKFKISSVLFFIMAVFLFIQLIG